MIIDNGSGHVKAICKPRGVLGVKLAVVTLSQAGIAGEDAPRCVFPAVVGKPKHGAMMPGALSPQLRI